jgi:cytochrome c peroxidase
MRNKPLASRRRRGSLGVFSISMLLASACANAASPDTVMLGRQIFNDVSLSSSGRMSCATCHDPAHAHAPANDLATQPGGAELDVAGFRAVPSLRYLNVDLPFVFQKDGTPTGGFNRDGRAQDLIEQAQRPFLASHEMANADVSDVVTRLSRADYADDFRALFGANVFDDRDLAFLAARFALSEFETNAAEFHPFDAKFDRFLAGKLMLSPQELRGFALFNRPDKGNCAGCHPSTRQANGAPPVFTDYTYDNLGVPRNAQIAATADAEYFDFGLCGPDRSDLAARKDLCGAFKVPTLRNVATRRAFFHNGYFHTLKDALRFYAHRDTQPQQFYPLDADGAAEMFDDLPPALRGNVNTAEVPYDRHPGQSPRLSDAEIDDVIAFLNTLTDGYDPLTDTADPARSLAPAQNSLVEK